MRWTEDNYMEYLERQGKATARKKLREKGISIQISMF